MAKTVVTPANYEEHKIGIQQESLFTKLESHTSKYSISLALLREVFPALRRTPQIQIYYANCLYSFRVDTHNALVKFNGKWHAWDKENAPYTPAQWKTLTSKQQAEARKKHPHLIPQEDAL